jgi:hypothetical protein
VKIPDVDEVEKYKLSQATRDAIENAMWDSGMEGMVGGYWGSFEAFCGLFFRLKYAEDSPELFPKGKWATLQHMEELIQEAIDSRRTRQVEHG